MTDATLHALAAKIAADLFTCMLGHGITFVLEDEMRQPIGYWSESAVRDRIYAALKEAEDDHGQ